MIERSGSEMVPVAATAAAAYELAKRVLGPTADYIGKELAHFTERRVVNLKRIFVKAENALGSRVDEAGRVPPRVLALLLSEGSFCDDELGAEYFGGVLASSRSRVGQDDRGVAMMALLGRLSAYQIRCHYGFYATLRIKAKEAAARGKEFVPFGRVEWNLRDVHMSQDGFDRMMAFEGEEASRTQALQEHVLAGLGREMLISNYNMDSPHKPRGSRFRLQIVPSPLGVELFLWAHGQPNASWTAFFDFSLGLSVDERSLVEIPADCEVG